MFVDNPQRAVRIGVQESRTVSGVLGNTHSKTPATISSHSACIAIQEGAVENGRTGAEVAGVSDICDQLRQVADRSMDGSRTPVRTSSRPSIE